MGRRQEGSGDHGHGAQCERSELAEEPQPTEKARRSERDEAEGGPHGQMLAEGGPPAQDADRGERGTNCGEGRHRRVENLRLRCQSRGR